MWLDLHTLIYIRIYMHAYIHTHTDINAVWLDLRAMIMFEYIGETEDSDMVRQHSCIHCLCVHSCIHCLCVVFDDQATILHVIPCPASILLSSGTHCLCVVFDDQETISYVIPCPASILPSSGTSNKQRFAMWTCVHAYILIIHIRICRTCD